METPGVTVPVTPLQTNDVGSASTIITGSIRAEKRSNRSSPDGSLAFRSSLLTIMSPLLPLSYIMPFQPKELLGGEVP